MANANWTIVIDAARWESRLDAGKYIPPPGYIYLILDITFRHLASEPDAGFSEQDIVLMIDGLPIHDEPLLWLHPDGEGHTLTEKGEIIKADGAGSGSSYNLEGYEVHSVGAHGSIFDQAGRDIFYSFAEVKEQQRSMVFELKSVDNANVMVRNFRLAFKDLPPILFVPDRATDQ